MDVQTSRFGTVSIEPDDVLEFPAGMAGLEDCRQWVLLADAQNCALGWLQSVTRPEIALAVVSPRRFVPEYQVRVARAELSAVGIRDARQAKVLVIVGRNERTITLNLKAPLVIHLERRTGRQVINGGDYAVQHELHDDATPLRKTA
jgi:flagellar assembly factor FliW